MAKDLKQENAILKNKVRELSKRIKLLEAISRLRHEIFLEVLQQVRKK